VLVASPPLPHSILRLQRNIILLSASRRLGGGAGARRENPKLTPMQVP
jgi:hypothetical protein